MEKFIILKNKNKKDQTHQFSLGVVEEFFFTVQKLTVRCDSEDTSGTVRQCEHDASGPPAGSEAAAAAAMAEAVAADTRVLVQGAGSTTRGRNYSDPS